ncbi:MAG: 23S rRNA (pseudouridine(1915)-N(3))-methyltransferase RlmH [Firmicutes bacterium]|nr:23S rRNA (pseudouridine(1915)-N(3))-methyltransferase RlmH [Bacillota bacterium]
MLSVKIICIGKLKEPHYIAAAAEYVKRLGPSYRLEITELPERSPVTLPKDSYILALCVEGDMLSSEALAAKIGNLAARGVSKFCFVIGGSDGLDEGVKRAADLKLSMSRMTFPHHLARVMLLEQLYRAAMINGGGKYHK